MLILVIYCFLKVLNLLIVIAYTDGSPAHAHFIDHYHCQKLWLEWLERLHSYQTKFSEKLSGTLPDTQ